MAIETIDAVPFAFDIGAAGMETISLPERKHASLGGLPGGDHRSGRTEIEDHVSR
jgi:hypothetical protein